MTFEEFQVNALNLGYNLGISTRGDIAFTIDDVGVVYSEPKYYPIGYALCRHWSDELICEHMRAAVDMQNTAEMALDYLELLESLERITVATYTDKRQDNSN